MKQNKILRRLRDGKKAVGIIITFPTAELVELMGLAGFDYVQFDGEHGPFTLESIDHLCRVADLSGLTPVARVPNCEPSTILGFLDRGITGIMGPHIETREEAEALVNACLFSPQGSRSWGGGRGTHYNDTESIDNAADDKTTYMQQANKEMLVMAQIESVESLKNLSEILKVEGLDALAYGPNDLAQSMGFVGQPNHNKVQEAMANATKQIHAAGKKIVFDFMDGIQVADLFLDAAKAFAQEVRKS